MESNDVGKKNESKDSESPSSLVTLLSVVDAYAQSQGKAGKDVKSSIWNIHKARRSVGSYHLGGSLAFTAHDVREDLTAQAVLSILNDDESTKSLEPDLIVETDTTFKNTTTKEVDVISQKDTFTLHLDGLPSPKIKDENDIIPATNRENAKDHSQYLGLRQRKGEKRKDENGLILDKPREFIGWNDWDDFGHPLPDDPISFFGGLTPKDLRTAQAKARTALETYVEAANLAVEIQRLIQLKEGNAK